MNPGGARSLRTLLVGIDGACSRVLDPLVESGAIPTLAGIFEDGAVGPLRSQIPPWTASAWPSLYTGTNPGKHGVFDFLAFDGYDWAVVDATHVRTRPIWEHLGHHGHTSVVVNVPVTHPSRSFDGALIPGYAAPEDPPGHPDGILTSVREAVGEYRIYPTHTGVRDPDREAVVTEHESLARMRGRAFCHLAEQFAPAFGFVQFQGTDSVIHELPGDEDAIERVYRAVDGTIEEILTRYEPETVIVASDHGVGPYAGYEIRVNEVLREMGLVETVRGGRGMPTWASVRDRQLAAGEDEQSPQQGLLPRGAVAMARAGLTSQRAQRLLEPLGLDGIARRLVPRSAISAGTEQVDFPNSQAYVRSRVECGIRINLEGREPEGLVTRGDYESVRDEIIERVSALETPDGDPAFEEVTRREAYFQGPATEAAVDVVTVPAGFEHFLTARVGGPAFGAPSEPWNHKRTGIMAIKGNGIGADARLGDAHLFDVAPTVLATLGIPADAQMDGDVLPAVEPVGTQQYPDVDRLTHEGVDSHTVENRLADLGYLE